MRKIFFGAALILWAAPLLAQGSGGPPGGGGGMGGPPGGGPPGGDRPSKPREMKPIKRAALDKAVTAMFREADANGDGMVTIQDCARSFKRDGTTSFASTLPPSTRIAVAQSARTSFWRGRTRWDRWHRPIRALAVTATGRSLKSFALMSATIRKTAYWNI